MTTDAAVQAGPSNPERLIEVAELKKHFPIRRGILIQRQVGAVKAVDGVSFFINRGETLGLVGESGCGKTTVGRTMLGLYPAISQVCGTAGIPFYNTPGNHDANYDGLDPHQHYETWRATFGPVYYSFDYGPVHFVILNDVRYPNIGSSYQSGFGETQLSWLRQDLAHVQKDQLIVLNMHIPLQKAAENSLNFLEILCR